MRKPAKPFVKGDPRINRAGRKPLTKTFGEYVRNVIEETDDDKKDSLVKEMLAVAISRAKRGQFQFFDAIINRAYGKVPDKVENVTPHKFDLSQLTKEELEDWKRLLTKVQPKQ